MYFKTGFISSIVLHCGVGAALWHYVPSLRQVEVTINVAQGSPISLVAVQVSMVEELTIEVQDWEEVSDVPQAEPAVHEVESLPVDRELPAETIAARPWHDEALRQQEMEIQPAEKTPNRHQETAPKPQEPPQPAVPRTPPTPHVVEVEQFRVEVVPLEAVALAGAKIDQLPRKFPTNQPPSYPRDALLAGIEGRVLIRVLISAEGLVSQAHISNSSGSQSLDAAALEAVRLWKFYPAQKGSLAVAYEVVVPVKFSISRS